MSLRTYSLLLLLALGALPLLALTAVTLPDALFRLHTAAEDRSMAELSIQADQLDRRLARHEQTVRILAQLPAPLEMVEDETPEPHSALTAQQARQRFSQVLEQWLSDIPAVIDVGIVDKRLRERFHMVRTRQGLTGETHLPEHEVPYQKLWRRLTSGKNTLAVALSPRGAGDYALYLASSLRTGQGEIAGMVVMGVNLSILLRQYGEAMWVNSNGQYLHRPRSAPGAAFKAYPGLAAHMEGGKPFTLRHGEQTIAWVPLKLDRHHENAIWLGQAVDVAAAQSWLVDFRNRFLVTVSVLVLLLVLLANRIAGWGDRLRKQLLEGLENIVSGRNEVHFRWRGPRELQQLAEEMNRLGERHRKAVAAQHQAEEALRVEKERAETTLSSIADGVITVDSNGRIVYMNPMAEKLTARSGSQALGKPLGEVFRATDNSGEPLFGPSADTLVSETKMKLHRPILTDAYGVQTPVEVTVTQAAGPEAGMVVVFRDVRSQRELQDQLVWQASHDTLTGLLNRSAMEHHITEALDEVLAEPQLQHWLCYIDLDQFKVINDTSGHLAGDEQLKQVALRLRQHAATVARIGGDEFSILLKSCDQEVAYHTVEQIRRSLNEMRFVWGNKSFVTSASFGLVPITPESGSVHEILSAADTACFVAKDEGRNRTHLYERDDRVMEQRSYEMQWVHRIRHALEDERFELYYQPIARLGVEDRAAHGEILLRMYDEQGQLVPPDAFIPAAERYNLMVEVDQWVLLTLLKDARRMGLQDSGHECLFSVNLSAQSLSNDGFLSFVVENLARSRLDPALFCFEITETAAIANLARATEFISVLTSKGCRFALDDFGSGLSSFGYLKNLPVDYLKIDGSFVRDIMTEPMDLALVRSINDVGHVLGIKTVAEFVETREIRDKLTELGVDFGQGFGIAYPEPLEKWWERRVQSGGGPQF